MHLLQGQGALSYLDMRKHGGAREYLQSHVKRAMMDSWGTESDDIEKKGVETLPLAVWGYRRSLIY